MGEKVPWGNNNSKSAPIGGGVIYTDSTINLSPPNAHSIVVITLYVVHTLAHALAHDVPIVRSSANLANSAVANLVVENVFVEKIEMLL